MIAYTSPFKTHPICSAHQNTLSKHTNALVLHAYLPQEKPDTNDKHDTAYKVTPLPELSKA